MISSLILHLPGLSSVLVTGPHTSLFQTGTALTAPGRDARWSRALVLRAAMPASGAESPFAVVTPVGVRTSGY